MNIKLKIVGFLTMACLIGTSLFWIKPFGIQQASALSATAQYGGFLYPWRDDPNISTDNKYVSQNTVDEVHDNHTGQEVDFKQGSPGVNFDVLAPKDGVVIYASDSSPDDWHGNCPQIAPATNYIVLGHGYVSPGVFSFYTVYYHLKYDSIPNGIAEGSYIRLGQKIGVAGTTGYSTGNHLHFMGTDKPVNLVTSPVKDCSGNTLAASRTWVTVSSANTRSIGFEEAGNQWPLLNGGIGLLEDPSNSKPASYNWTGIQQNDCNPISGATKVVLYNHINYGGECVNVSSPDLGFNVPLGMHISSIYLNPLWLQLNPQYFHTLTLWDGYNQSGNQTVIGSSQPRLDNLPDGNWNDRTKSVHNALHNNAPWLLEESYAFQAPFNVNIHIRVANDPDFNAWRVCFDGQNCQENATPINELYYTWNTYGWADGNHTISIQYRRTSDNGNWASADYYETSFYLNPNRQTYAPCGTNTNGARLVSGSDCTIVTTNVADMAPVGWADRGNLSITAQGYDVLAYDSSDFVGAPRLIRNGQTVSVGGNVSGIELRQPLPASYVPTSPLGIDSNTIVYLPMDEGSGSQVFSQVGSLTGSLVGSYAFTPGRFGSAVDFNNPPEGSGINFGAQNFGSPWTIEMFVKVDSETGEYRLANQLGGSPNTGYNKWIIGLSNRRFWTNICYTSGCHETHSLEEVEAGRWYYLMLTYDGNVTEKFYVDSVLQQTATMDGVITGGNTTFEIGKGEGISSCNCTIDDFRISNIVREPLGPPAPTPTSLPTSTALPTFTNTPMITATNTSLPTFTPTATSTPVPWNGGLVSNGSFETLTSGWANNWTRDNTSGVLINTASHGNNGTNSLFFTNASVNHHAFSAQMPVNYTKYYQWLSYVKATTGSGEFGFYIDEYNSSHTWISGQWFGALPASAEGTKTIQYKPSSSSVVYAALQYYMNANTSYQVYVDSVSFNETTVNRITNGGFEYLLNGWADGWTRDNTSFVAVDTASHGNGGTKSLRFSPASSNAHAFSTKFPVSSGTYTWGQYVNSSSGTGEFGFYIDEYDASGNWISGQWKGGIWGASNGLKSFTYSRSSSSVAFASIQFYMNAGTTFTVYVDSVSFGP